MIRFRFKFLVVEYWRRVFDKASTFENFEKLSAAIKNNDIALRYFKTARVSFRRRFAATIYQLSKLSQFQIPDVC